MKDNRCKYCAYKGVLCDPSTWKKKEIARCDQSKPVHVFNNEAARRVRQRERLGQ